ncbi:glycine oxidase ThiO [Labrenzia sp. PHM005]|uniref:glycine oxidase ThiO n=1 Tax=Labrenzia sp. PHM005 TaxID=2590016 RepID=UPI00114038D3|nr:glycine oxidase ThiO [Labrenzia sp. PHM005]QDG77945.1 glycine oxidase ThiO [Labrenzia sp. PHM005]
MRSSVSPVKTAEHQTGAKTGAGTKTVVIKGAGVAGLALTYELATRGVAVTVVDPSGPGPKSASWYAGGMLAPWCERENAAEDVLLLGKEAVSWWETVLPGHVHPNGTLVVAPPRDRQELSRFASRTSCYDWIDGADVGELEPDLAGRFSKALFFKDEAHLDPRKALTALKGKLEKLGVRFCQAPAEVQAGAEIEVDCTGMKALETGLRGVRGEMAILHAPDVTLSRPVRLLHPRIPVYIVPRDNHHFMVGATMIESDQGGPVTVRSLMELLNAAYAVHPAFAEAQIVETGTGVRPAYADNFPQVRQDGNRLSLNGFYRHGFLLAPSMAQRAANQILSTCNEAKT